MPGRSCGRLLRCAAAKKINVTFRLDDERLHVTIDPQDLPAHPERRSPVTAVPGRAVGIDLNPSWIGLAIAENVGDPSRLEQTKLLDHALIELDHSPDASAETVREVLAAAADRAVSLARQYGAGVIGVEKGLGKLRSSGKNRKLNQLLNYWGRTVFVDMLRRKAGLSGIKVIEVWGGYSTTIGNSAFEAPDACASACEIARRAVARLAGLKDVLPVLSPEVFPGLWKDRDMPNQLREELRRAKTWGDVHRGLKAAKTFGYGRPHPKMTSSDPGGRTTCGLAVRWLCRRRRPGLIARPIGTGRPTCDNPANRGGNPIKNSTRKSG